MNSQVMYDGPEINSRDLYDDEPKTTFELLPKKRNINSELMYKGSRKGGQETADNSKALAIVTKTPTALKFPIHAAARSGDGDEIEKLLGENKYLIDEKDALGRTPLHYAAKTEYHVALDCVNLILECSQLNSTKDDRKMKKKFKEYIDIQDNNGETALHLALKSANNDVVEELIMRGVDTNLVSKAGQKPMELIYFKQHRRMLAVFDSALNWSSQTDPNIETKEIVLDLRAVMGTVIETDVIKDAEAHQHKFDNLKMETERLEGILQSKNRASKELLEHPFVKLVLYLKWKKIKTIFWISILFHIIWLILYTVFTWNVYVNKCPYLSVPDSSDVVVNENSIVCDISVGNTVLCSIVVAISIIVGFKEIFELSSTGSRYITQFENIGQWLLIFLTFLTSWPVFAKQTSIFAWQYQAAAFAIILAWALILSQIGKLPSLEIYVEVFSKILKRFAFFGLTFISLLIAFALSLSILLPESKAFECLPLAVLKVFVMMAGELNYDDVFYENEYLPPFPVSTQIIFITFTVIVTVLLFNLLLGFTINDIQELEASAKITTNTGRLEQIYIIESFILSTRLQQFFKSIKKLHLLDRFFLVTEKDCNDMCLHIHTDSLPTDLKEAVLSDLPENEADNLEDDLYGDEDIEHSLFDIDEESEETDKETIQSDKHSTRTEDEFTQTDEGSNKILARTSSTC